MTFPAKMHRSALMLTGIAIVGGLIWSGFTIATSVEADRTVAIALICFILAASLCIYPHRFELKGGVLKVRIGLVVLKSVNLADVTRVYLSKGWPLSHTMHPVSGWRLSTAHSEVLVIPEDEAAFFIELQNQSPHLHRYGNELRTESARQV